MKVELLDYMGDDLKVCRGCKNSLPTAEFYKRKDRSDRLRPYCKTCSNDIVRARYEKYKRDNPFKHKCVRIKSKAKYQGLDFNLSPEYLEEIWTGVCPVYKINIYIEGGLSDNTAELDRFDPDKGYVEGNVHFLSRKANSIKSNANIEDLELLITWMKEVKDES